MLRRRIEVPVARPESNIPGKLLMQKYKFNHKKFVTTLKPEKLNVFDITVALSIA